MNHYFIACFLLIAINTSALDQLPDDIFNLFMHQAVSLKDAQGIFSVVAANKKLLHQSKAWCIHERDPHIIEKLLHKACNNAPWTVCFALCNPSITSTIVGNAINDTTSHKSQKLLSARFPLALQDGSKERLQIKHRQGIASFIRNGFIIKTVYDRYGRSMPPLIYFSNCIESSRENSFYPYDCTNNRTQLITFELNLRIIKILLEQKANPSYGIQLPFTDNAHHFRYLDPYSFLYHTDLKELLTEKECIPLKNLLDTYKRTSENNNIPYFE